MLKPKRELKIACITGASSGIGLGTAQSLAEQGFALYLGARRLDRLLDLTKDLIQRGSPKVECARLDVRELNSVREFELGFAARFGSAPDVLVNNAGLARGKDAVHSANLEDWQEMIGANLSGLAMVTHAFLPSMLERMAGDIVMIGSIAGSQAYEGGSMYCATKAGVTAFTNALRLEVNGKGIRVIQIDPGMVETEFSLVRLKDSNLADKVYEGVVPLSGRDIGDTVAYAVTQPSHVCITNLTVMPTQQASVGKVHRTSK